MGKQFSFIMDEYDEKDFFEYVNQSGAVYFSPSNENPKVIYTLPESNWFKLYLHKESFGVLICNETKNGRKYIDSINSPVIEFRKTIIHTHSKEISRGRLWMEMKYFDSNGNLVIKKEAVNEWYKELSKWIKKNLVSVQISSKNKISKEYVSKSLVDLVEENYKLLG